MWAEAEHVTIDGVPMFERNGPVQVQWEQGDCHQAYRQGSTAASIATWTMTQSFTGKVRWAKDDHETVSEWTLWRRFVRGGRKGRRARLRLERMGRMFARYVFGVEVFVFTGVVPEGAQL